MASTMDAATKIIAQIKATLTKAVGSVTVQGNLQNKDEIDLADGTGVDKADLVVEVTGTITGGAGAVTIDLAADLTDLFGDLVTFARIKALLIQNESAVGDDAVMIVGGSATPWPGPFQTPATDSIEVRPGGCALFATADAVAWPVTADTADLLGISNESATKLLTYRLTFVGEST